MKSFFSFLFILSLSIIVVSCKNDTKVSTTTGEAAAASTVAPNDSKALEGTGAADISTTYKLDQTQIVQEGNVAFNFKSQKSLNVYIKSSDKNPLNFEQNEVFAIFADKTIKETSFSVEGLDIKGERPVLNLKTVISSNTVPEYRPSYVVTVPKNAVKGVPLIRLDGSEIPVFGMQ